ncbi:hypothetical protein ACFL57_04270 [Candidatus Margulisiibacteriota bacterium]
MTKIIISEDPINVANTLGGPSLGPWPVGKVEQGILLRENLIKEGIGLIESLASADSKKLKLKPAELQNNANIRITDKRYILHTLELPIVKCLAEQKNIKTLPYLLKMLAMPGGWDEMSDAIVGIGEEAIKPVKEELKRVNAYNIYIENYYICERNSESIYYGRRLFNVLKRLAPNDESILSLQEDKYKERLRQKIKAGRILHGILSWIGIG